MLQRAWNESVQQFNARGLTAQFADDVGRHEGEPFENIGAPFHLDLLADAVHGLANVVVDGRLDVLERAVGEWGCKEPPASTVFLWVLDREQVYVTASDFQIPCCLHKGGRHAVDLSRCLEIDYGDFGGPDSHNGAIFLM